MWPTSNVVTMLDGQPTCVTEKTSSWGLEPLEMAGVARLVDPTRVNLLRIFSWVFRGGDLGIAS